MPSIQRSAQGTNTASSGTPLDVTSVLMRAGLRKFDINAGGTGYTNGTQTLTIAGGTFGSAATVSVEVVGGVVTTVNSVLTTGDYTANPSTPNTPTGGGGTGCTLNITMADSSLVVMVVNEGFGPSDTPSQVTYGGTDLTLIASTNANFQGPEDLTLSLWFLAEEGQGSATVSVIWSTGPGEQCVACTRVNGINLADKVASSTQQAADNFTSGATAVTTSDEEYLAGFHGWNMPSGDDTGSVQNSFTFGQKDGTTGGGRTSNRTIQESFRIVSAKGSYEVETLDIAGLTTDTDGGSILATFKFTTVAIADDLTNISTMDATDGEVADDTVIGTSGQTNTDIKMEGAASIEMQSKAAGVGGGGVDIGNDATTVDFTGKHIYTRTRSIDAADVEAAGGWRIRILDTAGTGTNFITNFSEWPVGGSDTTGRITTDGFITHCVSVDEGEGRTDDGTSPADDDVADGVASVIKQLSFSGQNTFFLDHINYGPTSGIPHYLTVTGGEVEQPGTADDMAADDATQERGLFKDIGGVFYILTGVSIGDVTASTDSYFTSSGKVWNFESQNVANLFYTVRFVGGTGINSAIFGNVLGSGVDEVGVAGDTFIATRRPFNFDATDSDIIVAFYGCTFLNSGEVGGTIKLEHTNIECISSLFDACDIISIRSGAEFKKCTVTASVAIATTGAIDLGAVNPGSNEFRDVVILNCNRAVQVTPTGVNVTEYDFRNITYSGNTFDVLNDGTATQVSIYADTNQDQDVDLNGTNHGVGQSITGIAGRLASCQFMLNKTASPTGNAVCRLYAISGAHGSTAIPTGAALASSQVLDVSTLDGTLTLTKFQFHDEFLMVLSTDYFLSIEYTDGDGTDFISVGSDGSSPTDDGNQALANTGFTWVADDTEHIVHDSYVGAIAKVNVLEGGDLELDTRCHFREGEQVCLGIFGVQVDEEKYSANGSNRALQVYPEHSDGEARSTNRRG